MPDEDSRSSFGLAHSAMYSSIAVSRVVSSGTPFCISSVFLVSICATKALSPTKISSMASPSGVRSATCPQARIALFS